MVCELVILATASDPSLNNTGTAVGPSYLSKDLRPNQSTVIDEKQTNWKSTASATAKLLLRGVNESADAFGPLKSVAGGLCFILDNCEVMTTPHIHLLQRLQVPKRTKANKEAIESLAPRVEALSGRLCVNPPLREMSRSEREERRLEG
jgi:hypothetical protein